MSPEQRCPVCEGCGTVPPDFYTRIGMTTSTMREPCRRCGGLGTIAVGPCAMSHSRREALDELTQKNLPRRYA